MADGPISLSRHRKDRARAARRAEADANAVRFGRSKAEKQAERTRRQSEAARLDGHRLDDDPKA